MSENNKGMPMRQIPQSLAAEAVVLGSIILEATWLGQMSKLLNVESFYRYERRSIYEALVRLFQRELGKSFDSFLLRDELIKAGGEIWDRAYGQREEVAEFLDQAEANIFGIARWEKVSSIRELG